MGNWLFRLRTNRGQQRAEPVRLGQPQTQENFKSSAPLESESLWTHIVETKWCGIKAQQERQKEGDFLGVQVEKSLCWK